MPELLLRLLEERIAPARAVMASRAKGGEYHSPCPLCGGRDRFLVFPGQPGGALCRKHGLSGTWACPRHCGKGGDLISFLMAVDGLSFSEACAVLGIRLGAEDGRERRAGRGYRPLLRPGSEQATAFAPRDRQFPPQLWRRQATALAREACANLARSPLALAWLARRGLPRQAALRYGLGWITAESPRQDCISRRRAAFGLPLKVDHTGRIIRALRIPRGIAIPVWGEDGLCLRLRVRRRDADISRDAPHAPKYLLLPQPGEPYSAPLLLPPVGLNPDLAVWLVVEAELDALAAHWACGGRVGVLSVLSVRGKPDRAAHAALSRAARVLVALDCDEDKPGGGNPGAEAWPWWEATYPRARLWPVPVGKDPGEAFALGVDLREWIFAGLPGA